MDGWLYVFCLSACFFLSFSLSLFFLPWSLFLSLLTFLHSSSYIYISGMCVLVQIFAELPIGALFPAAFGALVYPACGLHAKWGRFVRFMGILTAESFVSGSIGLAVGSAAPNTDSALVR